MTLRSITLISMGLVLFFEQGYSQQVKSREEIQTSFVLNNFILNKKKADIRTITQVDSLLRLVEHSWKRYVRDSLGTSKINPIALNNVGAYIYQVTLLSVAERTDIGDELNAYLVKQYMLPSVLNDYELIRSDPRMENAALIGRPAMNTVTMSAKYYKDVDYMAFYKFYSGFRTMVQTLAQSNPAVSKHISSLISGVRMFDYDIEAKYSFLTNQSDLALGRFVTGLSVNNYYKPFATQFGVDLLKYFESTKETDKALTVLNTLMLYTSADDLSRDSLTQWYTRTDAERGPKLYQLTLQKISGNPFKTSNIATLNTPVKWNFISNILPEATIANAKYFVVDFWYTACSPCIAEIPDLNELAGSLKNRQDIVFLSINTDYAYGKHNQAYVQKFVNERKITFPVVYDTQGTAFNKLLKVAGYPAKFILDNKGRVVSKIDGSDTTLETVKEFLKIGGLK